MKTSGIYCITNLKNGKKYIGSGIDIFNRWSSHRSKLKKHKHFNLHLQRAWDQYGEDAFEFSIICYCRIEDLIDLEQKALDEFKPEYNLAKKARSMLGLVHTEKARKKMSIASKGNQNAKGLHRIKSEDERNKISRAMKGRDKSDEHKKKISQAWTQERRDALAERNRQRAQNLTNADREHLSQIQKKVIRKKMPNGKWARKVSDISTNQ